MATHTAESYACLSTVEGIVAVRSDDDTVIGVTLECHFPSHPLITSRICHVFIENNPNLPDAPESRLVQWDIDPDDSDDDLDLDEYHAVMEDLVDGQAVARLKEMPSSSLLLAPRDPMFIVSTIEGTDGRTVQLRAGLPGSLQEIEAMCLRRLKNHEATRLASTGDTPVHDIDTVLVLSLLDAGTRSIMRVLLPDHTIGVMQWVPTVSALLSAGATTVKEAGTLHEMQLLRTIPPHPHIIGPPIAYVSREFEGTAFVCGFVLRLLPGGNVRDVLVEQEPVALERRVKWAYQLARALVHIHHVAHTYHGDIKLDNIVLDANDDAVLIDFEQGRANEEAAAPEVHAGCLVTLSDEGKLLYHPPPGCEEDQQLEPLRHRAYPYDAWLHVPRAIEAAEVHALGFALSNLFKEEEVPSDIVHQCRTDDPNERPVLKDIEKYFRDWYMTTTM